jgi:hypothetical protein
MLPINSLISNDNILLADVIGEENTVFFQDASGEFGGNDQQLFNIDTLYPPIVKIKRHRKLQRVSTLRMREKIIKWMIIHGEKQVIPDAIAAFPGEFTGSYNANYMRASRLWKYRDDFALKIVVSQKKSAGRFQKKAFAGREPPVKEWVVKLHEKLLNEFHRVSKAGVKMSPALIKELARHIVQHDPTSNQGEILPLITDRWVQHFRNKHDIVVREVCGKLRVSPDKEVQIEKAVAFHLGEMKRLFDNPEISDDMLENIDETHFTVDLSNSKTLGIKGEPTCKFLDIVSSGNGMTMIVRVTQGGIMAPMLILTNDNRSYPIRGTPDDQQGVCYRSQPSGWMEQRLMPVFFNEPRAYQQDQHGRRKIVFMDNCAVHNPTPALEEVLKEKNTELRFLPPNSTHLVQPADSFLISKLKDAWRRKWEKKKCELIQDQRFSDVSGKLENPGHAYFLKLASECVVEVNKQRDSNGLNYARKALIITGMSRDITGVWHVEQLRTELQAIILKHKVHFNGKAVDE